MRNTKQAGSTIEDVAIYLVVVVVCGLLAWLDMSAPSADIQAEIRQDRPFPISYHVLQAFLRAHPQPTNENMMYIHQTVDSIRSREIITNATRNEPDHKGAELQGAQKSAVVTLAPTAKDEQEKDTYLSLAWIGLVVLVGFPLAVRWIMLAL